MAGPAIAGRRDAAELRTRLESILESRAFHPVFQPIVEVETGIIVGFEALTRFDDGVRPDVRFAEADGAGLAALLEIAAVTMALEEAPGCPATRSSR